MRGHNYWHYASHQRRTRDWCEGEPLDPEWLNADCSRILVAARPALWRRRVTAAWKKSKAIRVASRDIARSLARNAQRARARKLRYIRRVSA